MKINLGKLRKIFCKNEFFCKHKRKMILILVVLIIGGGVTWFLFRSSQTAYGLTTGWEQTDWSGGISTTTYPRHSNASDRNSWTNFWEKENYVETGSTTTVSTSSTLIEKSAVLPQGIKDSAACYDSVSDKFYIFGGYYLDGELNSIYSSTTIQYDAVEDIATTSNIGKLPVELRGLSCASVNSSSIYLLGGYNNSSSTFNSVVYKFDPSNSSNQASNTGYLIGQGRKDAPAVYAPNTGKIYLFGGYYLDESQNSHYMTDIIDFNPETGATSSVGSLTTGLRGLSASYNPDDGMIYIFGGADSTGGFNKNVYQFNPSTGNISDTGNDLPDSQGREFAPAVYYSDIVKKFYIFGGYYLDGSSNPQYLNKVVSYSTSSGAVNNTETIFESNGLAGSAAAYSSKDMDIYVFGGYNGTNFSNKILVLPLVEKLTSSPYDTTDPEAVLNQISWTESISASTDINFQIRTGSNNNSSTTGVRSDDTPNIWTSWCGPDNGNPGTCSTSTYFTDNGGGETVDEIFKDGSNDHWIQYKLFLSRNSLTINPTLADITMSYDTNSSPVLANVSASQNGNGTVSISYDISDIEDSSATTSLFYDLGITLADNPLSANATTVNITDANNILDLMTSTTTYTLQIEDEQINCLDKSTSTNSFYNCTRGANNTSFYNISHNQGTAIWIKANFVTGDVGLTNASSSTSTKNMVWTAKSDIEGVYSTTTRIKVNANDKNTAWSVGHASSSLFTLDIKNPTLDSAVFTDDDASPNYYDQTSSATATLSVSWTETNASSVSITVDGIGTYTDNSPSGGNSIFQIPISGESDGSYSISYNFIDQFSNATTTVSGTNDEPLILDSTAPAGLVNLNIVSVGAEQVNLSWQEVKEPNFDHYEIWYSTSSTAVENRTVPAQEKDTMTNKSTTNTAITSLTEGNIYYFKLWAVDVLNHESTIASQWTKTTARNIIWIEGANLEGVNIFR